MAIWRRALTAYEAYAVYYAATNSNASFDVPGTVTLHIATSGTTGAVLESRLDAGHPAGGN